MLTAHDEASLVVRAQDGDTDAFGELVAAHQRFVYNLCLRAVGDPREAEDLAQETFLRAWLAIGRFRREARFSTWLYRIAVNQAYSRLPRLRRELAEIPAAEEGLDLAEEVGPSPAQRAEVGEQMALLREEIRRLPASHRMMVLLRFQMDCPYEEIAEILDVPLGTVKTGLFRSRARLREALRLHDEEVVP